MHVFRSILDLTLGRKRERISYSIAEKRHGKRLETGVKAMTELLIINGIDDRVFDQADRNIQVTGM